MDGELVDFWASTWPTKHIFKWQDHWWIIVYSSPSLNQRGTFKLKARLSLVMIFLSEEWATALVDSKCTKLMDWKFANLKSFVFVALIHPKPRQKVSLFSWLSFVDVKRSLCTTHNWWQRNEQRPKNERSKVFLHFQVDASCILTWTSKLGARNNRNPFHLVGCNPVEKRVLICKPRPPGRNNVG